MASTTDATYQPRVYREHGGENLIIGSSGDCYIQSGGDLIVESGGTLQLDAGSSFTCATNIEMASGYYVAKTVTSRGTSQVATAIPLGSICAITASTTTPEYKLATPVAGAEIVVALTAQTSSIGCKVYSGSTGIAMATSGSNMITMLGVNQTAIFHAASATRWYVSKNTTIAFGTHTT